MKQLLRDLTPPFVWRLAKRIAGRPDLPTLLDYQGVITPHNMEVLHRGHFAEAHDRYWRLDPHNDANNTRLRQYFAAWFAKRALGAGGDFLFAGVSYGVAPRVLYDYLNWQKQGRIMHLVDPFLGIFNRNGTKTEKYNTDPEFVRRQYPLGANVVIHQVLIPDGLPLTGVEGLAFVHLDTGDYASEAASLQYFHQRLRDNGILIIDNYAIESGHQDVYNPALAEIGADIVVLPTGQALLLK
jgi:hypothetical protein